MSGRKRSTPFIALGCLLLAVLPLRAQVARVAASQRTTEKKTGEAAWLKASVGANLSAGDKFRTGKRSKADLKFRDGSLVRLGQLSNLEFRDARQMRLERGQLLFVALRPGRILAGAAAAEIKGSVALVQFRNFKNNPGGQQTVAEFFLYSGAMDIVTALGTVSLAPGQKATVFADGTIQVGEAPPLQYFGGELHPDILRLPRNHPFAGSPDQQDERDDQERIEIDRLLPFLLSPDFFEDVEDFAFPEEEEIDSEALLLGPLFEGEGGGGTPFAPVSPFAATSPFGTENPFAPNAFSGARLGRPYLFSKTFRFAAAEESITRDAQSTRQPAEEAAARVVADEAEATGEFDLDASPAYAHLHEAQFNSGYDIGGDAALAGALGSGGRAAYGARLHAYAANDGWFADAAYFPLRVRSRFENTFGNDEKDTRNFSAISDLSLTYTQNWGEAQVGRQRFLGGPTQATLYGSLVRAGGREIMDAVRVAPRIGDEYSLELAYLHDAFPQHLPYRVGGNQNGFYGRVATHQSFGNIGLNVLKYSDADVDDTTGATLDFALPILRDKLEFYGEVGRDPFRRRLRTFGITLPWLYEKTGWDVYFETAKLRDSSVADGPPTEYAVRAYKRLNGNMSMVAAASRFSGESTKFILGLSVGARTSR